MSSGGGGSSAPTQQTITQTTIPEWAKPYATRVLGEAEKLTYGQPYQEYGGQRMAGLNPLQQQAYGNIAGMGPASQIGQATGFAGLAGLQAQQMAGAYQPMQERQFYQPMDLAYGNVEAPQLRSYQMGGPERIQADRFGIAQSREYMSPYMQDVVEQQKQAAVQDYARQLPGMGAAAARAGAKGGTREALVQAEAQRNLQERLGGIEATGRQQAFQQAQQQFGADRAAQMQAALANQQAGLTTGQQNLAALLGVQQLGAGQALQAQQLNQAAQLQAQQQMLGQRGQMAQFGLQGAELADRSRQFGANLGLQGIQQQLAAAQALGGLGQQQFAQQQAATQAQMGAGQQLQMLEQQRLEQQYQDFLARQRYPYAQLGFMSDVLRGTPAQGAISSLYQAPPSAMGQLIGAGTGLAGIYGALKGG